MSAPIKTPILPNEYWYSDGRIYLRGNSWTSVAATIPLEPSAKWEPLPVDWLTARQVAGACDTAAEFAEVMGSP